MKAPKINLPLIHVDDKVRQDYHPGGIVSLDIKTEELSADLKLLICDTVEAMIVRLVSAQRKYEHGDAYQEKEWAENGHLSQRIASALFHGQTIDALNLTMFALHHDINPGMALKKVGKDKE